MNAPPTLLRPAPVRPNPAPPAGPPATLPPPDLRPAPLDPAEIARWVELLGSIQRPAVREALLALLQTLAQQAQPALAKPEPLPPPAPRRPVLAEAQAPVAAPPPESDPADLADQLQAALLARRSGLTLRYQPVVSAQNGALTGFEALLRWTTPAGQEVPPLRVVAVAEAANLSETLDFWVLQEAVTAARPWVAANPALTVAINVTSALLTSPLAVNAVRALLRASGVAPGNLCIEVTETTLLDLRATENLAALRKLGLQLAIDDFGVGQSALARLMELDVDVVKLDRAFFSGREPGAQQVAFLASMVAMAKARGSRVVAEGIASREDAQLAQKIGCAACQGFWFAGPLSAGATGSIAGAGVNDLPWTMPAQAARR